MPVGGRGACDQTRSTLPTMRLPQEGTKDLVSPRASDSVWGSVASSELAWTGVAVVVEGGIGVALM